VSLLKLTVLSIVTFGIYELFWFYQQWKCIRRREDISPFWRTFFSGVTSFGLFKRIANDANASDVRVSFNPVVAGALVMVLSASSRLPQPWWLVSVLSFAPVLPVQATLNRLNAQLAPDADRNERWTASNYVVLVLGTLFLGLAILGTYITSTRKT
jgi:hypothetical protein